MESVSLNPLWQRILQPDVLGVMFPIVVVVMLGLVITTKSIIRHRERMALIEMGLHPDHPPRERAENEGWEKQTR